MPSKNNPFTAYKMIVYPDLATALADNRAFGYNEMAKIAGDNTRFKIGDGIRYSSKNPFGFIGSTFAQLPWFTCGKASYNPPTADQKQAINATGNWTAAQMAASNYITSTSAAATNITIDTVANLVAALAAANAGGGTAPGAGSEYEFTVNNLAGASTVTIVLTGSGIAAGTPALTGGASLAVPAGQIGKFKIVLTSGTAGLIYRLF